MSWASKGLSKGTRAVSKSIPSSVKTLGAIANPLMYAGTLGPKNFMSALGIGGANKSPQLPGTTTPDYGQDAMSIQSEMDREKGLNQQYQTDTSNLYDQQKNILGDILNQRRQQNLTALTTGPEGEAFRDKYNNLGLLNSGAFNTGLSNVLGNQANQDSTALMGLGMDKINALQGIMGQGYDTQSNLGMAGLDRKFGLEDAAAGNNNSRSILQYVMNQQRQNAMGQGLGGLAGGLFGYAGGGFPGAQAGAGIGSGLGGLFAGLS